MPFETELEWAKDICTRQGYYVIQQSRVQELQASTAVSMIEWDQLKHTTSFKAHVWHSLGQQIGAEIIDNDRAVLKNEREDENTMMHIMQARVRVIRV